MSFVAIIPARYASSRLPGKPLRDIAGMPMIRHVYERACESGADRVVIATDNDRIQQVCENFGADVCMTAATHQSGSERLAEVVDQLGLADDAVVVNVQGDEPLLPPALIRQVADNALRHSEASIATLCTPIGASAELFDPNAVKVVMDERGYALYFSRAPIPWDRDAFAVSRDVMPARARHFRHIGLYAYRARFLRQYIQWPPCALEQIESLEQLRALAYGQKIHVDVVLQAPPAGVDTEHDLQRVIDFLAR